MSRNNVLFQLSGSIACYKACAVISTLVQKGCVVKTVCSRDALQFVGKATLEGLTGFPVAIDLYEEGRMMDHISLSRWADVAILCPASANTLNKLAAGISDSLIGALFLAYPLKEKPYLVAPAMNHQMFQHPATEAALTTLSTWGVRVLPCGEGHQACGEEGPGRLLEPEQLVTHVLAVLDEIRV